MFKTTPVGHVPPIVFLCDSIKLRNSLYSHTNSYNNAVTQCHVDSPPSSLGYLCMEQGGSWHTKSDISEKLFGGYRLDIEWTFD